MRPVGIVSIGGGLAALLALTVVVEAQHEHGYPMSKEGVPTGSRQDERVVLNLNEQASAGLKLTMREHLEAIRDVVAALGQQDFLHAAKVVHEELGFPKHHEAMTREAGATFPSKEGLIYSLLLMC